MKENDMHVLIAKFLSGEAEICEIETLKEWRKQSLDNEQLFQKYQEACELIHVPVAGKLIPDREIVWNRIISQIERSASVGYSRPFLLRMVGIAATFTLFIGFSLSFLLFSGKSVEERGEVIVKTQRGQKSEVILPDGSTVWLNGGSSLTYATDFQANNRKVQLTGEAFFDVAHNNEAFKVNIDGIQVQVHGTTFNANAYRNDNIEISLLKGHVTVHALESDRLLADLAPGYKANISNRTQETTIAACDAEIEGLWRYEVLKIIDEPMARLIKKMEHWYGVNITFKDTSRKEHYWLTIKTEPLTEILTLINKTTPINYSINGEEVIIGYK